MKKFFAIAMLALLLFNLGGYLLLFQYLIYQSDRSIIQKINNNHYKSSDLVEVKIPVHLNIQDWTEFEPISGVVQQRRGSQHSAQQRQSDNNESQSTHFEDCKCQRRHMHTYTTNRTSCEVLVLVHVC